LSGNATYQALGALNRVSVQFAPLLFETTPKGNLNVLSAQTFRFPLTFREPARFACSHRE
jgi:hypothetical protein